MLNDPTQLTAFDLLSLYRTRALSPVEVTQAVLSRIEQLQPLIRTSMLGRGGASRLSRGRSNAVCAVSLARPLVAES
jgi:aspartyl-tRNA(Asn)/glutamyl-tRNA(Gln) amidotransferase subunit A